MNMKFPPRRAILDVIKKSANDVFSYYNKLNLDPGYQGHFENKLCRKFKRYMGGGFADAVNSGTSAVYLSLKSLNLKKKSHILVSPITDPGTINAIVECGLRIKLMDCKKKSYHVDLNSIKKRLSKNVSAVLVVHSAGQAIEDIKEISIFCKKKGVKLIEDCSQAIGAKVRNKKIGSFGDISAFSLMFKKKLVANGTGGIVFTKNKKYYNNLIAYADRGKPIWKKNFDPLDPNSNIFVSLNFHLDEISCCIAIHSLSKLNATIQKRIKFIKALKKKVDRKSKFCKINYNFNSCSPFFLPIEFNSLNENSSLKFALSLKEKGVPLNPRYKYLVSDWNYIKNFLYDKFVPINAKEYLNNSFNIYLNENYKEKEASFIVKKILEVEKEYEKKTL